MKDYGLRLYTGRPPTARLCGWPQHPVAVAHDRIDYSPLASPGSTFEPDSAIGSFSPIGRTSRNDETCCLRHFFPYLKIDARMSRSFGNSGESYSPKHRPAFIRIWAEPGFISIYIWFILKIAHHIRIGNRFAIPRQLCKCWLIYLKRQGSQLMSMDTLSCWPIGILS